MEGGPIASPLPPRQRRCSPASLRSHLKAAKRWARETYRSKPASQWALVFASGAAMLVAFPASSLLSRLYFQDGGSNKWIISWAAAAGWPVPALALVLLYSARRGETALTPLGWRLAFSYLGLGFLSAADNLMYAYAYAYLPASTAALLASSSLAFSALFGYLIVKNPINASTLNAIATITAAVAIVALDSESDRYPYVTRGQYAAGFAWDIAGSALHGLIFALSELVFVKLLGSASFHVVLEQQAAVSVAAFAFSSVGVVVAGGGVHAVADEAQGFRGGPGAYWRVVAWAAVAFQVGVTGATAAVFLASTVFAGVLNAVRVPITAVAAVALMGDPMSGFKILSLAVTAWGFACYVYGGSSSSRSKVSSPTSHGSSSSSNMT